VKKILKICLFILTEFTNVTDRHTDTDRQTPHDDIGRACMHRIARQKFSEYRATLNRKEVDYTNLVLDCYVAQRPHLVAIFED